MTKRSTNAPRSLRLLETKNGVSCAAVVAVATVGLGDWTTTVVAVDLVVEQKRHFHWKSCGSIPDCTLTICAIPMNSDYSEVFEGPSDASDRWILSILQSFVQSTMAGRKDRQCVYPIG